MMKHPSRLRPQPSRAQAKARAARRSREGGAVIFIVAMTLAVLAALGAYALQSASMEIKSAGYERQNSQTHYLSEYGVLGAMQNVSPDTAQLYLNFMLSTPEGACTSLPGTGFVSPNTLSKACRRMGSAEMANAWTLTTPLDPWTVGSATPGSLGIIPVKGDYYMEMTEPTQAPMAIGFDTKNGMCFVQFTVSSYGMTQPSNTPNNVALFAGEGIETARARIVGGPVKFSGCGQ